jgi:magnesium transporter
MEREPGRPAGEGDRPSPTHITVIDYDREHYDERELTGPEECARYVGKPTVTWINVDGLADTQAVRKVGECFGAHELILEDILHTDQRPKADYERDKYLFFLVKMLQWGAGGEVVVEQVSLLVSAEAVVSFVERKEAGDVFDPIRKRLRNNEGRIRSAGTDFLAYALIDAVVDGYFGVVEALGEQADDLEEELIAQPTPKTLSRLHGLRRQLLVVRQATWPLREVVNTLQRGSSPLIAPETAIYLRDLYDHIFDVIETVETLRDMVSGMLDIYLSGISYRLNEVMKVLTIIATIFIPLTFIAGVYGMNFRHMPVLYWRWGYSYVWTVMISIVLMMLIYFRRRRWM